MPEGPVIRPYQADALEFLVKTQRAALFDEPGLGKSMQSLLAMRDLEPHGRILIVAPGDATGVWQDECRFWLDEEPGVFSGLKPDPSELRKGIAVTNYRRLADVLELHHDWQGIIFDESHILRNRKTSTLFRAVRPFFDRARYGLGRIPTFALSGTPVVKSAGDLWPILHILDRRHWNAYWQFVQKYAVVWEDAYGWHVQGTTNTKALWAELDSVSLRRTIKECQPWLPEVIRQRVPLRMTPKQARAYADIEREMMHEVTGGSRPEWILAPTALARETRLRQLLVSPRLLGIDDPGAGVLALREVLGEHERPIVVFTPWTEAFPFIMSDLKTKRGIMEVRGGVDIHGEVRRFHDAAQAGDAPVLLVSLAMAKSWSVATATYENYMLGFDWNESTMIQAERRLGRDGQKSTVFSRYFVHEGSHDFDALDVLAGKRRLSDVIIDRKKTLRRYHA